MRPSVSLVLAIALVATTLVGQAPPASSTDEVRLKGDIVFLVDESGSMASSQAAVRARLGDIAGQLDDAGVDFRLGLVGFEATPRVLSPLTDDLEAFSAALQQLRVRGGWEVGFDAVLAGMADSMGHREDAATCAIMVTDEDADVRTTQGTRANALAALQARNAVFLGIVRPTFGSTAIDYGPAPGSLAAETGGAVFDIAAFRTNSGPVLEAVLDLCLERIVSSSPPVADAGGDRTVTEGDLVTLDGSASSAASGLPLTYDWELVAQDGPPAVLSATDTATPSFRAYDVGEYTFRLTVTAGELSEADEVTVRVDNAAPELTVATQPAYAGGLALVNATFTDRGILDTHSATIDWGDGNDPQPVDVTAGGVGWGGLFAANRYPDAGSYEIVLEVVDDDGGTDRATASVQVAEPVALWANASTGERALDWNDVDGRVSGLTHTNAGARLRGTRMSFTGPFEYVTTLDPHRATFDPAPVVSDVRDFPIRFELADYRPDGSAAAEAGDRFFDHTDACDPASGTWHVVGTTLPTGIHYAPCDVKLNGQPVGGQVTIAAEGAIEVAGTRVLFDPFHDGLLFVSGASGPRAITVSASNSLFFGHVFAADGQVRIAGANNRFVCGVLADTIDISGNGTAVTASGCTQPERTGAPPLLVPTLELDLAVDADEVLPGEDLTATATVGNRGATLLVYGVVGAENLGEATATITGYEQVLEYQAADGTWVPVPGEVTFTLDPIAADGVGHGEGGEPDGTSLAPGSLAAWGYQAQVVLDPAQVDLLLDADQVRAVRTRVELTTDPADVPVRRLFRFGDDIVEQARDLGADVTGLELTLLPPVGEPLVDRDVERLAPGQQVEVARIVTVPTLASRGEAESDKAYLARLQAAAGRPLLTAAFATGSGGVGSLVATTDPTTTVRQVPVVSLTSSAPASLRRGDDLTVTLELDNQGSAGASELALVVAREDGTALEVDGVPAQLDAGDRATATATGAIPEAALDPRASTTAALAWSDAAGNTYGPVAATTDTAVLGPAELLVFKTGDREVDGQGREVVRYQITVANLGDEPLTGVTLTDRPDPYTVIDPDTLVVTQGTADLDDPAVLEVDLGEIGARDVATVGFTVTVSHPLPFGVGEVANQAIVQADGIDEVLSDDPSVDGAADPTVTRVTPGRGPGTPSDPGPGPGPDPDPDPDPGTGPGGENPTPPTIGAVGPEDGTVVTAPIPITAAFAAPEGEEIVAWRVLARRVGSDAVIEIGSGTDLPTTAVASTAAAPDTPASDDPAIDPADDDTMAAVMTLAGVSATSEPEPDPVVLAELDPSLLANGTYLIEVAATGSGGGTQTSVSSVVIDGQLKLGRVVTTYEDLRLDVAGTPLAIRRAYDSIDPSTGDFGRGWQLELDSVEVATNRPLGHLGWRTRVHSCAWGFCVVDFETDVPHVVTVTWPGGKQEIFDLTPTPTSNLFPYFTNARFTGRPGTTSTLAAVGSTSLTHFGDGNLYTDFGGAVYDPKRFRLTDVQGTVYLLDRDQGLISVTDRTGDVRTVGADGIRSSEHGPIVTFARDGAGRITSLTGPDGATVGYSYDGAGDLVEVVDPRGGTTTYTYDGGRLVGIDAADGQPLSIMTYDERGRLVAVTDAEGNTTTIDNDLDGRTQTVTSADGRLTTLTTFDDRGNVVRVDEAFGGRTLTSRFTYDDGDRRTSRTDPLGRTWEATYDAKGNLTTLSEPTGAVTRLRYGSASFGQPVELTDAEGGTTRMDYDAAGNVLRVTDPTDREVSFTYDQRGRRTSMTDAAGTVQWRYDSGGRLVGSTDANGHEVTYTNDAAGRPVTLTDARGGVMAFTYDAVGNLTDLTDPEGGQWSWVYDARNRLQTESDPSDASTVYRYDGLDRLVEVADPLGGTVELGWDAVDNLVAVTDPTGGTTSHTYDGAGRLVGTTDPTGRTVGYEVDAVGRVVTVTDPVGRAWQQTYDDADRLVSRRSPTGVEDRLEYDLLGRLTAAVDGLGHRTTLRYDAAGRLTSVTDAAGSTTRHEHDDAGRLMAITDALDGTVGFTYDAAGQLTALTDPLDRVRTFTYDPAGNLVAASDPATGTSTFTFDLAGRMTSARDARGIEVGLVHDAVGRTIRMDTPDGAIHHLYDAKGRRTRLIDKTGVTAFTYDPADRVVAVAAPSGPVGYGYDAAGRRVSMTDPDGAVLAYGYGDDGSLATLTDPDLGTVGFEHDADGRLATIERPNGVASTYRYDDAARLVEVAHTGPAGAVATFTSQLDAVGNRTALSGPDGTASYVLDELYRLIGATEADGTEWSWSYDAAGNRLTETADGTTTVYGYDADTGRLIDVGGRALTYDAAGNVTADGAASYTWDWAGRLVTANIDGTTSTAVYDGDGTRVGLDGITQHWDRLGPWPLLIGAGAERVVHAAGPLAEVSSTDVGWLHGDPLGSVRTVTGPAGQSVGAASFTAFGERSTSGQASRFGFVGEQHDPSGLVYLRARMLDPALGRLLSADPVQPNAPGTQGFHRYSYTANNPTSWTDPTGNVTLVERAVVTGISSTLAGAGIGASIGWFTCGGLSGNLDLACLARETAAGAAGGAVAAIPGVGILGGLGVAGGAGVAESLVRQGMQGGIDPLQVGIDGMLSAATFGIARHTLGPLVQRLRGAHLTNQTGPVSIQPGSHLPAPRALDELRALPRALDGGPSNVHVYFGVRDGKPVYTGITNSLARRQTQHGDRFVLQQLTSDPLTRGQARAIEQALIVRNPGFENAINSISPNHAWYQQAVDWGEAWLRANGY